MLSFYNIPIFTGNSKNAVSNILEILYTESTNSNQSKCISATSAHGLVEAYNHSSFKIILQQFYFNLPDGMPLVWWGLMKGQKGIGRCYGPEIFSSIICATSSSKVRHFFCGGRQGVAEELKRAVYLKWGNKNVVGTYTPPFTDMTEEDWKILVNDVECSGTDVIWIGLSTPKQEKFAFKLSKLVNVKFIITVGAAFDFHTDRLEQAPNWMQRAGLEWFFRLIKEPFRLWGRYAEIVPKFALLAGIDLLKYYLQKRI